MTVKSADGHWSCERRAIEHATGREKDGEAHTTSTAGPWAKHAYVRTMARARVRTLAGPTAHGTKWVDLIM